MIILNFVIFRFCMAQELFENPFAGFNPIDGLSTFPMTDPEEPMWEALIGKIIDGKVIPIIGPDFLSDKSNLHQQLIQVLASHFKVTSNPTTFSELVYDKNYLEANHNNKDSVYTWINQICGPNAPALKPSELLVRLLESKLFPFIITTSFIPLVEQTMRRIWKDDLKILIFNNNPSENGDIDNESDLLKPTIYYMFGRVGDSRPNRYVVTDQDMLDFCSSWLSSDDDRKPYKLIRGLKDKFLLMLGTDYSDWLFRFIWYSIRKESELRSASNDMISSNVELEESFIKFMKRNNTYLKNNPEVVISQISERMEKQYELNPLLRQKLMNRVTTKFSYPEEKTDIFISYSRRDAQFAADLYEALTNKGLNVWYDKQNLTAGGKFMKEIKQAIKSAKFFVPIFTHNVEAEKNSHHVYRYEWDVACEVLVGRTFIIPVYEKGFDFYHSEVPEKIRKTNAIRFDFTEDLDSVVEKIMSKYQSVEFK